MLALVLAVEGGGEREGVSGRGKGREREDGWGEGRREGEGSQAKGGRRKKVEE